MHIILCHFLFGVPCSNDQLSLLGFRRGRCLLSHVASIGQHLAPTHAIVVVQKWGRVVLSSLRPGPETNIILSVNALKKETNRKQ